MRSRLTWILLCACLYGAWRHFSTPDATVAAAAAAGYTVAILDDYDEVVRILSTHRYAVGREAELSPIDLAVAWGPVAQPEVYGALTVEQSMRWYRWRADPLPLPQRVIETHSANVHIVPSDATIAAEVTELERDDLVRLRGHLIEVRAPDGWRWRSSLSREDTGAHACELLLLESIERLTTRS